MTKKLNTYKCDLCGNIVSMIHDGGGYLVCCKKNMTLLTENSIEANTEKHIPVVEKITGGYLVKIGSIEHPMTPEHYIEWIEIITEDSIYRKFLKPGDKPEATFSNINSKSFLVREYCNLHGLWKNSIG